MAEQQSTDETLVRLVMIELDEQKDFDDFYQDRRYVENRRLRQLSSLATSGAYRLKSSWRMPGA